MSGHRAPRLLLVTGLSGAGKSTVLDTLEDMGWDTVDNLPVDLLEGFLRGPAECRVAPAAVAMDSRSRGFDPLTLPEILRSLPGVEVELLYLDCSPGELIRRFDSTRRRHPLAPDRPAEDGIERERRFTEGLREAADTVLDTTDLSPAEIREEMRSRYAGESGQPVLTISSFSFARGISRTADLVFDVRFLPNPHWVDGLRELSGEDAEVRTYLEGDPAWEETIERTVSLLNDWIPRYWAAGKNYVTVAFGCTGGRHRSVAAAIEVAERLRASGFDSSVRHRDLGPSPGSAIRQAGTGTVAAGVESELNR